MKRNTLLLCATVTSAAWFAAAGKPSFVQPPTSERQGAALGATKRTGLDTAGLDMHITRTFDAPVQAVWEAWTTERQLKRWWGPKGFTCPVAGIRFRVGEKSLVAMKAPAEHGGQTMYNTWHYLTIQPQQRLEFVQGWADETGAVVNPTTLGLPPGMPAEVRHVLVFRAVDANTTELSVTEYGYASADVVQMSKQGMNECLDKLATTLTAN